MVKGVRPTFFAFIGNLAHNDWPPQAENFEASLMVETNFCEKYPKYVHKCLLKTLHETFCRNTSLSKILGCFLPNVDQWLVFEPKSTNFMYKSLW
jgi:hypothetical protein